MKKFVILDNIRSAHNVGSIFRTSDGAGVSKVFLVGHTPAPIDRFGREQPEIKKTSLGATNSVEWESCEDSAVLVKELKEVGVEIISVEQEAVATDYQDYKMNGDTAYVFGNEVDGVSQEFIDETEQVMEIPQFGTKHSLNVSVAAGISIWELYKLLSR